MVLFPIATVVACLASIAEATSYGHSGYKTYDQDATDQFNILKHQGGNGPYSVHPGWGIDTNTPEQCTIEQAHLYIRHGERYPTVGLAKSMRAVFDQIPEKNLTAKNKAYFLNTYKSPSIYDLDQLELESTNGPYNGYSNMYQAGADMRHKYGHLYKEGNTLPFFTASQNRIAVTSLNVARGFFGANWTDYSHFVVLNETANMGLNSLTPEVGCPDFNADIGDEYVETYANIAFEKSLKQLLADVPGLNITAFDYGNMMSLCMYDLNVQGSSPLCDYFSTDDWVAYDHFRALDYYYYSGRGNPSTPAVGGVVVDAALKLLSTPSSPDNGTALYFNFMHETNVLGILTALGIADPTKPLSATQPEFNSRWRTSQLVPMGVRFAIEKLSCKNTTDPEVKEEFIRMTLNDAVFPHDECTSGPGFSCPIEQFVNITKGRFPDAIKQCGINSTYTAPKELTFYWDWQSRTDNYKLWSDVVPSQF